MLLWGVVVCIWLRGCFARVLELLFNCVFTAGFGFIVSFGV